MIGVDVGGTFTDIVAIENGRIKTAKVPTNPNQMENSVLEGAEQVGLENKTVFNHASTAGLNAVLTRNLPKIAFLTTMGHRDIMDMGRAWRPLEGQTDPHWRRPFGDASAPLVPRYLRRGIKERLLGDGSVLIPLDEAQAVKELGILKKCEVQGVAICLLNSYINAAHELQLKKIVKRVLGDIPCSISSEVSPLAKEFARASTTVIDVLMKLVFDTYLRRLVGGLKDRGYNGKVNLADCAAMLVPSEIAIEHPFRVIFSGPSAGTISTSYFGELIGDGNIICCDIGGTSTDISVVNNGQPFVNTTFEIEHDLIVNTLANEIYTLGAGGGSIVSIGPSGEVKVGPESAGADPGPACYGKGGTQPTITDACLLSGILNPKSFLGGKALLYPDLAKKAFERLDTTIELSSLIGQAFYLALNHVTEGLINITVRRGLDPRDYSLMAYGSAGPMLVPAVMQELSVRRVIVPPMPGLFSALGLLSTDLVHTVNRSAYLTLSEKTASDINRIYEEMEEELGQEIGDQRNIRFERSFDGHLKGQTWETPFINVPPGKITPEAIKKMVSDFHDAYEERWGNRFDHMPVVSATYRSQVIIPMDKVRYKKIPRRATGKLTPENRITLRFLEDRNIEASEYERTDLMVGDMINGPAIIREPMSTTFALKGQQVTVGNLGELIIERSR